MGHICADITASILYFSSVRLVPARNREELRVSGECKEGGGRARRCGKRKRESEEPSVAY